MDKLPFLKSQRNWVFERIKAVGLDPTEFEWSERETADNSSQRHSILIHRPTQFYYFFGILPNGTHTPEYSPGKDKEVGFAKEMYTGEVWRNIELALPLWLKYLKREIEAPDLWTALQQESQLIDAAVSDESDDKPFTADEIEYIRQGLSEIKKYIASTQDIPAERLEFVNKRLDYLQEAAKRQGKQSWIHRTIGVLFTIVIGAALSPDAAREMFRFAAGVFRQITNAPLMLP